MAQPELLQILERTLSQNPVDQQQALQYLHQACETNYNEFARQLATILGNSQNSNYLRQAAGIQLKNTLATKESFQLCKKRWYSLTQEVRTQVKQHVTETLGSEGRPSTAAQCIAAIACIEMPDGNWLELVDGLMANVTNVANAELKRESSLETIGYLCQDLPLNVLVGKANLVLTAIASGIHADEASNHIRLAAVTAMLNALEFTRHYFDKEQERNEIMAMVCTATQSTNQKVKIVALQCLVRIMSLYYHLMPRYIAALFQISTHAMRSEDDDTVMQGIEFWSTVCEEEMELEYTAEEAKEQNQEPQHSSKQYALNAIPHIVPLLTGLMAKQEDEDDDDEWVPSKAAGVCLMLLAQCCRDPVVDAALPFITQHFISTDWQHREAAIMAFGSIMEGPSKPKLMTLADQAILLLIANLEGDNVPTAVKDTAAWAIGRVCDNCVEIVIKGDVVEQLLNSLLKAINDEPRVAVNVCWAISSFVKASYKTAVEQKGLNKAGHLSTFVLTPYFDHMVSELIKTTERTDAGSCNLRVSAYETLMELIRCSAADCYSSVLRTTMVILSKLDSLYALDDKVTPADRSQMLDFQSQLCATLYSALHKIEEKDALQIADKAMTALMRIMAKCFGPGGGAVIEEALLAVMSLIELTKNNFAKYMMDFKPYLLHALDLHEDSNVCIAAIGIVSDLCRVFESDAEPLMDEIVQKYLGILSDDKVNRTVKSHVLGSFGDIAIGLGPLFKRYFPSIIQWCTNAVNAAVITDSDDYDQVDYIEGLRENCCLAFTGMTQAIGSDSDGCDMIRPHLPIIFHLIVLINDSNPSSPESLCGTALALVGDLLDSFDTDFLKAAESKEVGQLVEKCKRAKDNKARTISMWIVRQIDRVHQMPSNADGR